VAKTTRFGIAGIGNEGSGIIPHLLRNENVEFAGAADLRLDALDALRGDHPSIQTFDSIRGMCASGAVDAIWIATPNPFHAEHAIAAAENGVHVVLEKPMAVTLDEAHRIVEAVERAGTRLILHSHASDPPIVKMREIIASGRLGRLIGINATMHKSWLRSPRLPFELDTSKGGGVVFRQGPHQIEIVRRLGGGLVKSVRGYPGRFHPAFETEGNYTALLEFEDGAVATMNLYGYGFFDVGDLTWHIGEGGTASSGEYQKQTTRMAPADPSEFYSGPRRSRAAAEDRERHQPIYGLTIVSCERGEMRQSPKGIYLYTDDGCEEIVCDPWGDKQFELNEIHNSVAEDRPAFPDARWGRATLEVILAILESGKQRRDIRLEWQSAAPA
jgi:phthalate 4,5-cis-dihydrodiol dehydrogenase